MSIKSILRACSVVVMLAVISMSAHADWAKDTVWTKETHQGLFSRFEFIKNDEVIVGQTSNRVIFYETKTGNEIMRLPFSRQLLFINEDSQFIMLNESKTTFEVWDYESMTKIREFESDSTKIIVTPAIRNIAIDKAERYILCEVEKGLRLFDIQTGKILKTYHAPEDTELISWTTAKKGFVEDGNAILVEVETLRKDDDPPMYQEYDIILYKFDRATLEPIELIKDYWQGDIFINSYSLSNTEKYILYHGEHHRITVYDYKSHTFLYKLNSFSGEIAFSSDDKYIIVTAGHTSRSGLKIWNLETGELIYSYFGGTYYNLTSDTQEKYFIVSIEGYLMLIYNRYPSNFILEDESTAIPLLVLNGEVKINLDSHSPYNIAIYGINGNTIFDEEIFGQELFEYNISHLAKGVYFIQVQSNQNIETYKFIKE